MRKGGEFGGSECDWGGELVWFGVVFLCSEDYVGYCWLFEC